MKKEERRVEDWGEDRRASEVEIEAAMASSGLGFEEIGDPPWLVQDWDLRKSVQLFLGTRETKRERHTRFI